MKRYGLISGLVAALIATASCTNDVEIIWSDENAPMLLLNAQLRQDYTRHTLYVYCSEKSNCEPVDDAAVTATLNSKSFILERHEGGKYVFDAELKPGDVLEFKASWKGLNASASAVVPAAAGEITQVTVTEVTIEDGETSWQRVQEGITFKDRPGVQDYYMLAIEDVYNRLDGDGNVVESLPVRVSIDAGNDKVLNPMGAEMTEFLGYDNDYNIFTDEMFADASYTFKVYTSDWAVYSPDWSEFMNRFNEGDPYSVDRVYKIYSIDFDEYVYLNSISANGNDLGFMTEPVVFTENVRGGLGFVTVVSPVTYTLSSGPKEYHYGL